MICYVLSGKNTLFCLLNKNICVRLNLQSDYVGFYENRQNINVTSNIIIRRVVNSFFSQLIHNNFFYV